MNQITYQYVIVIPVRDALEHVQIAVGCAMAERARGATVLLIDDASRGETAAYLAEQTGAYLVQHPDPRGYAHALNTAALFALDLGIRDVVAANSDTAWAPGAPGRLLAAQRRNGAYFAGPALGRCGSGQTPDPEVAAAGPDPAALAALELHRTCGKDVRMEDVNGAFFTFQTSAWVAEGPFDERFELGAAEEIDWMRRSKHGLYVPSVCVWHAKHASYEDHPEIDAEQQWRSNNAAARAKWARGEAIAHLAYPRVMPHRILTPQEKVRSG